MRVGLICEGPTDRAVLARLLDGLAPGTVVNAVQPPSPMGPADFGGWLQVFASIERRDVSGAQQFNDLVVVQIDTDVCEQPGYDVPRRDGGRELDHAELVDRVRARLRDAITTHDPDADLTRVAFAICVNELECWLLLHLGGKAKTTGCTKAADALLRKRGQPTLASKDVRDYEAAAQGLRKPAAITAIRGRSASLDAFLAEVSGRS